MIRLAVFDIDNTLVGADLTPSTRVRSAIALAQQKGVTVALATGRGPVATAHFARLLELPAPFICFQGSLVYDWVAGVSLHAIRLEPAIVPFLVRLAEERGWNLSFETTDMVYLPRQSNHPAHMLDLLRISLWARLNNLADDMPEVPFKFGITLDSQTQQAAVVEDLRHALWAASLHASVLPTHPGLVEGTPPGTDKAVGAAWLAERLGIPPAQVLAVGDHDNDAGMLAWAGVGVAVADGSAAARAAADWIAPGVADDGAAVALERCLNGAE
jgi:Cof subfamily protein (haloacid dehalogenase superfamily)